MNTRTKIFLLNLGAIAGHADKLPKEAIDYVEMVAADALASDPDETFNTIAGYAADVSEKKSNVDAKAVACKSCGANIVWMKTFKGKNIPVDLDSYNGAAVFDRSRHVTHFDTCPNAEKHRGGGRADTERPESVPQGEMMDDSELPF